MSNQQAIPTILRPPSGPNGVFVIWPGWNVLDYLAQAEDWSQRTGCGACVYLMPGTHNWPVCFEFKRIGAILGFGMKSTRIVRFGNMLLKSVRDYAEIDHAPQIGQFEIYNEVETDTPAIEIGSAQNVHTHSIYSWGAPADLLLFTNAERTDTPPPGKPVGTWTENITIERVVVYGPKSAAIRFRCTDPRKRDQSFSYLRAAAQITLVTPGSIGIDFESHCHCYAGQIAAKLNVDYAAEGNAIGVNVGPECNITGCGWDSFIEGVPEMMPDGRVIKPAGYRIRVASSARVSGHGKFYRQRESHTPDDITPGVNWAGEPSGTVKGDILAEEGI